MADRTSPGAGPAQLRRLFDAVVTVGADLDLPAMLQRIVESAADLVDARYGALGVLDERGTGLTQFLTVGITDEERRAIGPPPVGHGLVGLLVTEARPMRLPDLTKHPQSIGFPPNHPPMRSFLGVPIVLGERVFGNLYLTDKTTADAFTEVDEELVVTLASAAAVALDNARLHARVQELALVEDHERIARELHDNVIQRLFATGLSLRATLRMDPDPGVAGRLERAVDDLDVTIRHIRTAIFGLDAARTTAGEGLRSGVLALARDATRVLGFEPAVTFVGAVDAEVDDPLAADALAVVREGLANVARHAGAGWAAVELRAGDGELVVRVLDDGVGPPPAPAGTMDGLGSMAARAARRGGTSELRPRAPAGAELAWRVPL